MQYKIFAQNIDCGYTLELPCWDSSNEYGYLKSMNTIILYWMHIVNKNLTVRTWCPLANSWINLFTIVEIPSILVVLIIPGWPHIYTVPFINLGLKGSPDSNLHSRLSAVWPVADICRVGIMLNSIISCRIKKIKMELICGPSYFSSNFRRQNLWF